jgi:hypothetical protein
VLPIFADDVCGVVLPKPKVNKTSLQQGSKGGEALPRLQERVGLIQHHDTES